MPPASKRKRQTAGGGSGPKSKKGKRRSKKPSYSSGSEDEIPAQDSDELVKEEEEGGGGDEWEVELVVDKRVVRGVTEYFVKWKGWPAESNTWEPLAHLDNCPELVEAYEAKKNKVEKKEVTTGFDHGLVARSVQGIVQLEGGSTKDLCYLVEWEDHDRKEKIPSAIVREKIPQEVIKFLESKIKWTKIKTPADEQENNRDDSPDSDRMSTASSPDKDVEGSDNEEKRSPTDDED